MWRNAEFESFINWLRGFNGERGEADRVSFHGLDLYNMSASITAVIGYLDRVDPAAASEARELYGCLKPWKEQPAIYGRMALSEGHGRCEAGVLQLLRDLFAKEETYASRDLDSFLDAPCTMARLPAGTFGTSTWPIHWRFCFNARDPAQRWSCGPTTVISETPVIPTWGRPETS
jgi:erythromycin esterase-like protein